MANTRAPLAMSILVFLLGYVWKQQRTQTPEFAPKQTAALSFSPPPVGTKRRRNAGDAPLPHPTGPRDAILAGSRCRASPAKQTLSHPFDRDPSACKKKKRSDVQSDILNLPRLPARFSFEELKIATENFCHKLGQGGFGSVFEGKLADNTKVAVKKLEDCIIGQGSSEFLAEVETIGSLHHINVVRLIGFCAETSHRLLVFEFMKNGSLDKWIFDRAPGTVLDWQTKAKIIIDIAKGLSYLHEECRQKIAHFYIKPQNILLDKNFNAKVADFGLAKMIDHDQREFNTRMRGTIGYLAPEWFTSVITEKVDVFSFGIVVMEIVSGRKNLEHSQPEEGARLISLLQEKVRVDRLLDMVDRNGADIQLHGEQAVEMMRLAMWCLQTNNSRRPSMSMVVKVLEGNLSVETNLDYNFYTSATLNANDDNICIVISNELFASHLSGPR